MDVAPDYRLHMVSKQLQSLGQTGIPDGFYIIKAGKGFRHQWAEIAHEAGEFASLEASVQRFDLEFASAEEREVSHRVLYLCNNEDEVIGSATSWFHPQQKQLGRLHFVAMKPRYQGRGLIRPLLEATLDTLQQFHTEYWLTTQPRSVKGIKLYLDYGFLPVVENEEDSRVWKHLFKVLGREWRPDQSRALSFVDHPAADR
ncbi:GNAT family N-acetyltransferase [Endozoicomonas arenosclerae]|uniref:GNAT family N-acetyltransferase n=1 Tax=Endozoicomonas arenosclerae TaxID=1633495 RepID=UPI000780207B|nr:GNAT family N-acetyltransferase [Endozoicomonas arenosclerae]